ncbi:hypothetical protein CVS41_10990 [Aeromonas veronii]|nr:hypothetical protein CVS41_10990 [Aeromonas veronii]
MSVLLTAGCYGLPQIFRTITASQHHSITASQHHSITASQHHSITEEWRWLAAADEPVLSDTPSWFGEGE